MVRTFSEMNGSYLQGDEWFVLSRRYMVIIFREMSDSYLQGDEWVVLSGRYMVLTFREMSGSYLQGVVRFCHQEMSGSCRLGD